MRRKNRHGRQLYNAYDLELKKSVVIFAEENGNKEAQARYGISEANIRRWRRLKDDIFDRSTHEYNRGKLRIRKRINYTTKHEKQDDSSSLDSMPLLERLSKVAAQEKIAAGAGSSGQVLKSQPLSPTKLKVTRQTPRVKVPEPPPSPVNEEMCLRWNSHHSNMQKAFPSILSKEQYVDVTLAAEGKTLKCHRLILSSCSPYFEEILSGISPFQHPVLFMRDIPFWILKSLCDFMYAGEVHIYQNKLEELLTVAEILKIKGLAGKSTTPPENQETQKPENKQMKKKQEKISTINKKNPVFHRNNYESTSQDYDDDLLDPLDLLEPLYEEAAEEKKPSTVVKPKENKYNYQPVKKPFTRRLRKRKLSDSRDPSPPQVFSLRKGTRSRPNVKIPKYYHPDFTNPSKSGLNSGQTDPLLDIDEIKTEPIDVEDNLIDYSDEDHYLENSLETANCSPIIITNAKPIQSQEKFKKIKLAKPVITEVHTIEEPPPGGLEVIKITMPQVEGGEKMLQEVVIECTELGVEETDKTEKECGGPVQNIQIENVRSECVDEAEEQKDVEDTEEDKGNDDTEEDKGNEDTEEEKMPSLNRNEDCVENAEDEGMPSLEHNGEQKEDEETTPSVDRDKEEQTENERMPSSDQDGDIENNREQEDEKTESVDEQKNEITTPSLDHDTEEQKDDMTSMEHMDHDTEEDNRRSVEHTEEDEEQKDEERRTASLDHLEKEAMNVVNAIQMENQAPNE